MIAKSFKLPQELVDGVHWQDAPTKRLSSTSASPGRRDRVQRRHCLGHERDCAYQDHARQGSSSTLVPVMRHQFTTMTHASGG